MQVDRLSRDVELLRDDASDVPGVFLDVGDNESPDLLATCPNPRQRNPFCLSSLGRYIVKLSIRIVKFPRLGLHQIPGATGRCTSASCRPLRQSFRTAPSSAARTEHADLHLLTPPTD